jgi:hypothetical protein
MVFLIVCISSGFNPVQAQKIIAFDPGTNIPIYVGEKDLCTHKQLQEAIDAVGSGGLIQLKGSCMLAEGSVIVNKDVRWANMTTQVIVTIMNGQHLKITSGATLTIESANSIDLIVEESGKLIIDPSASIDIEQAGNTILINSATASILNHRVIRTSRIITKGKQSLLEPGVTSLSMDAPSGIYYQAGRVAGKGVFGNLFIYGNWTPNSVTQGNLVEGITQAGSNRSVIKVASGDGEEISAGQSMIIRGTAHRIIAVVEDIVTIFPALELAPTATTNYTVVGHIVAPDSEVIVVDGGSLQIDV